jgi:hypothetical protein
MLEYTHPDAWIALAKARHEAALERAAAYRRLPKRTPRAETRRLRDQVGDWLISTGRRIKTNPVPAETRPVFVHSRPS